MLVLSEVCDKCFAFAVFFSSWTLCFPGVFLSYFLNDFEMGPLATSVSFHLLIPQYCFLTFMTFLY
jgi:hypothetical protein